MATRGLDNHSGNDLLEGQTRAGRLIEVIGLIGEWPGHTSAEHRAHVGSATIVRCQTDRRAMTRLVDAERFVWIVIGIDQDESMIDLLGRLIASSAGAVPPRLAGMGVREDQERCERFMRRGCIVYLDGQREPAEVLRVLALAARHSVGAFDSCYLRSAAGSMQPLAALTRAETNVARLLMRGLSNAEIAEAHGVAISTVESHVRNIFSKLGARNRAHAAERARAFGL